MALSESCERCTYWDPPRETCLVWCKDRLGCETCEEWLLDPVKFGLIVNTPRRKDE